jgi:ornithine carrier protein
MQVQLMNLPLYMDPPSVRNLSTSAAQVSNPTLIVPARVALNGLASATIPTSSRQQSMTPTPDLQVMPSARVSSVASVWKPEGPWSILKSIVKVHGFRGLWLGHTGTMLRESGGSAIWFSMKEWTASWLHNRRRQGDARPRMARNGNEDVRAWESALAGALAGAVSTLLLYPADTVKSAVQTEDEFRSRPPPFTAPEGKGRGMPVRVNSTFISVVKQMYVTNGIKGFYSGCGMTVARAIVGSAVIFAVYDGLSARLA